MRVVRSVLVFFCCSCTWGASSKIKDPRLLSWTNVSTFGEHLPVVARKAARGALDVTSLKESMNVV